MFDVCWICHLTIDLNNDRTFTVIAGQRRDLRAPGLRGAQWIPHPEHALVRGIPRRARLGGEPTPAPAGFTPRGNPTPNVAAGPLLSEALAVARSGRSGRSLVGPAPHPYTSGVDPLLVALGTQGEVGLSLPR